MNFRNAAYTEYPLAKEAERTLKNGVPLLQRYLPFRWPTCWSACGWHWASSWPSCCR